MAMMKMSASSNHGMNAPSGLVRFGFLEFLLF